MEIRQLTNEEFNAFSEQFIPSSYYQTAEYAMIMNHQHYDSMLIGAIEGNQIIAASLILIEKAGMFKYAYAPRGFLIDYQNLTILTEFTKLLKKFLSKLDVIAIKICPSIIYKTYDLITNQVNITPNYQQLFDNLKQNGYFHMGYNNFFESYRPRFEAVIDLKRPYYEIFQSFKKEMRTKIRSADHNGIQIYRGTADNVEYLYMQTRKKYQRDIGYFKDAYDFFDKNHKVDLYYAKLNTETYLKVCKVKYEQLEKISNEINKQVLISRDKKKEKLINRKMIIDNQLALAKNNLVTATNLLRDFPTGVVTASAMIVKHQNKIFLLADGHDKRFKKFNSKHLLLWKIMEKYANLGYQSFSLGGVANPTLKENNSYMGLTTFKNGFHPTFIEYIGDLELITNNPKYFIYRQTSPLRSFKKKK